MNLESLDFSEVDEIFVKGGEHGFRSVFVIRKTKTQSYWQGAAKAEGNVSLKLEGGQDVNLAAGHLTVVVTGEVLEPIKARLRNGKAVDLLYTKP